MHWPSSTKTPQNVLAGLALLPHERVLAAARSASGAWYVGTNLAFHLPTGSESDGHRRVAWEDVERADWNGESQRLALVEVTPWGERERVTTAYLVDAERLLDLLRERVTSSVLFTAYARVRGRSGLTVVGRRSPSGDGPITWSYVLSGGLQPEDPEVALVAEETLAAAKHEFDGL